MNKTEQQDIERLTRWCQGEAETKSRIQQELPYIKAEMDNIIQQLQRFRLRVEEWSR